MVEPLASPLEPLPEPVRPVERTVWRADAEPAHGTRPVPEETAIAFDYDGSSYAVMMATPSDLQDFGIGFSLTEGIIRSADEVEEIAVLPQAGGVVLRIALELGRRDALQERQRRIAGPVGCGLCGIDSLKEALRPLPQVGPGPRLSAERIFAAMAALPPLQRVNRETRAVHAAAYWEPGAPEILVREDVGRHNALDKLVGALAARRIAPALGAILLTSRVSVEMVQKAAVAGASVIVAVSAPTALAVRTAEAAGLTLVGIARSDGFEIFTHPERIEGAGLAGR